MAIPEQNKLAMLLFLASEAIFFLMLVLSYVYFRASPDFEGVQRLDPLKTGIFSLLLFSSSGTIWLAERSLHQQRHGRFCLWLFATITLGLIFLAGQGWEWYGLINEQITISHTLFGTTFFTLTGFHGLHVLVGLLLLSIVLLLGLMGDYKGTHSRAVESIALYWHFVDGVWVVLFVVIYLWR